MNDRDAKLRPIYRAESELGWRCTPVDGGSCGNPSKFVLEVPNRDYFTGKGKPGTFRIYLCGVHARAGLSKWSSLIRAEQASERASR